MLTIREQIHNIVKITKPDGLTKRLKSKLELWHDICIWSKNWPNIKGSEKIYLYYHQIKSKPVCACGSNKHLKFISFTLGYNQFCSGNCSASWENRRKVIKENGKKFGLANLNGKAKQKATLLERYNVINPSQTETNRKNLRENNPMNRPDVQLKHKQSVKKIYNVENISRVRWPKGLEEKLKDRNWFEIEFLNKGPYVLAEKYNVYYGVFLNQANKYNLRVPYQSSAEASISEFLTSLNIKFKKRSRSIIPPLELDFFLPDYNLAIEYCGLYWHGEGYGRDKTYHINKLNQCINKGIKLITIFEDEWINKIDICKNRLKSILKKSIKGAGARQLTISEINPKITAEFLEKHHIQGKAQSTWRLGAFLNNKLVSVMTFTPSRKSLGSSGNEIELVRFSTDGKSYPGIASKMFKYFINTYNPVTVISYCDRRWSDGNLYQVLNFKEIAKTNPNYWYFKSQKRFHRFNFRKSTLTTLHNYSLEKTEREIMIENNYDIIWDCGNFKFIWQQ